MSKADKMFEELGFLKQTIKGGVVARYRMKSNYGYYEEIKFYCNKRYILSNWLKIDRPSSVKVEIHLAIHEKMKELGWI